MTTCIKMVQDLKAWLGLNGRIDPAEIAAKIRENAAMNLKQNEVVSGNFIYYIIEEGTNIRHTSGGVPVIYSDVDIADYNCNWTHEAVISVAAYNRIFEGIEDGE